jgi:endo-1,4-beta-D-glucanase Y
MIVRTALIVAVFLAAFNVAKAAPPPIGGSLRAPEFWQAYKTRFINPSGRLVDNGNAGISHSEGQGYGMILAVAADDRAAFDLLWQWTQAQLLREDGLFAWKWDPKSTPHVSDANNATDGDLLIAWALAEAAEFWPGSPYRAASQELDLAIARSAVTETSFGPVLLPGIQGFRRGQRPDGPVINLSYWVFPALWRLQSVSPDGPWGALAKSGVAIASVARFGDAKLPTDWISLAGRPAPAEGFAPTFSYDSIRVPLYLAWGGLGTKANLASYSDLWREPTATPSRVDVTTGESTEALSEKGYRAITALVRCAVAGTKISSDLLGADADLYYPTTLRAFVMIAAHQRYPQCLQ